jgi:tetratricopeptide (TPR) repeat protein
VEPDLPDLSLAEGLKLYYADYLPDAYPIVRTVSWFLPEGDREKGLELMRETAVKAIFARAEAIYFLGNINYNYEEDYDQALGYFKQLYHKYPQNNYYIRKLVGNLYRLERYDEALQIIDEALVRWRAKDLPYKKVLEEELLTWKGKIQLLRDDREQARRSFARAFAMGESLPRTRYRAFYVASGYNLGKLLYDQKSYSDAEPYLQAIVDSEVGEVYRRSARQMLEQINGN